MVLWGRSILGRPKGSTEGSAEDSAKLPPRFQQGFTKVPPRFFKFCGVSGQIHLGPPERFRGRFHQGSSKVSPRFHQGSSSFVVSLVVWGRSFLGCQKVPRYHVSPIHLQSADNDPSSRCCTGILWAYLIFFFNYSRLLP